MKKIILINSQPFSLNEITRSKYYGFSYMAGERKGFLCPIGNRDKWRGVSIFKMNEGNNIGDFTSLLDGILYCVTSAYELFEFETEKELFQWLSE